MLRPKGPSNCSFINKSSAPTWLISQLFEQMKRRIVIKLRDIHRQTSPIRSKPSLKRKLKILPKTRNDVTTLSKQRTIPSNKMWKEFPDPISLFLINASNKWRNRQTVRCVKLGSKKWIRTLKLRWKMGPSRWTLVAVSLIQIKMKLAKQISERTHSQSWNQEQWTITWRWTTMRARSKSTTRNSRSSSKQGSKTSSMKWFISYKANAGTVSKDPCWMST